MKIPAAIGGMLAAALALGACSKVVTASETLNAADGTTVNTARAEKVDIAEAADVIGARNEIDYRGYAPRTANGAIIHVFNGDAPDPRITRADIEPLTPRTGEPTPR